MKRWKMLACALMACLLTVSLIGCGGGDTTTPPADGGDKTDDGVAPAEKVVWRLGHTVAEQTALQKASLELADKLSAATDGNFVLEVYPNSQLGGNREMCEGVQFGTIEAVIPNIANLDGYAPSAVALQLPYLISDVTNFDAADKVFNTDVINPLLQEMEDAGFKWLGSWYQGVRHVTTTKTPVHTPADMKGLKIRTMESEVHMAHFNALGANAVPMAFSEVFTALQQGAIDGQENPYANIYTQGMHEVQGYITETAHIFDITPFLVSKTAFEALSPEYQKLLADTVFDMTLTEWQYSLEENEDYKQKILDTGKTEIIELSTEERQAFRDAAQPVYDKFAPELGADFLKAIEDAQK